MTPIATSLWFTAQTRGRMIKDSTIIKRTNDTHLNYLDNPPIFAAQVLEAASQGKPKMAAPFVVYVLDVCVARSVTNTIGTQPLSAMLRVIFCAIQIVLSVLMLEELPT